MTELFWPAIVPGEHWTCSQNCRTISGSKQKRFHAILFENISILFMDGAHRYSQRCAGRWDRDIWKVRVVSGFCIRSENNFSVFKFQINNSSAVKTLPLRIRNNFFSGILIFTDVHIHGRRNTQCDRNSGKMRSNKRQFIFVQRNLCLARPALLTARSLFSGLCPPGQSSACALHSREHIK